VACKRRLSEPSKRQIAPSQRAYKYLHVWGYTGPGLRDLKQNLTNGGISPETRIAEPQVSFAELEFSRQGVSLDPIVEAISTLLKGQGEMSSMCVAICSAV
jgi:hypothetical protein